METISEQYLQELYPTATIRAARISRIGEKYLGPIWSTADTCRTLGEENVGWFVGGFRNVEQMMDRVQDLETSPGGRWIVVPVSRDLASYMQERIGADDERESDVGLSICGWWERGNVTVCLIESLGVLASDLEKRKERVAGIIICDPNCIVHRARGFRRGDFYVSHDRPECVVEFRKAFAVGNWSPPLVVMSLRSAGAVSTSTVQTAYCLESFQFLDGKTIVCNPRVDLANPPSSSRLIDSGQVATGA